jgi:uncharacterized protein YyaL (SSP411 family)
MSATSASHTNRLSLESSPYLLQHAHNPVDWYPWGPEALALAKAEDRPIFLSIGYAACHWCHVMERESFENEDTAALLNKAFVSIKVDREERPDLDAIYMDAVQAMTGQGGWPMSVFLTPAGVPFYGGTYFPDQPRHGMPSFRQVLEGVIHAWQEQRDRVEEAGAGVFKAITADSRTTRPDEGPTPEAAPAGWMLDASLVGFERSFDARNGGWGGAPKFPQPMAVEFLLREHVRTGDQRPLAMARRSLDAMAAGGIFDHLGGGFARYATDASWLVPHFEKMLYDNAQLARVYVHAFQVTGERRYREVVEETLAFVEREMLSPEGGFVSSLDADTDGDEGATYVWTKAEIDELLGPDAPLFNEAYGVTANGNWEGRTILSRLASDDELARSSGHSAGEVAERLAGARQRLLEARGRRTQPARDDKVLASWNGLMIAAFADAARVFQRDAWQGIAIRAADLLLMQMRDERGRLHRSFKDGRAHQAAVLEDYAHAADGLLALYEATFDERWFVAVSELMDTVLEHFADSRGGFFDTADDHEALITRPKSLQDNAIPSGNAMAAWVLLRLSALTGEGRYRDSAEGALRLVTPAAHRYPTAFGQWLIGLQLALAEIEEIAIVGDPGAADTAALLDVVRGRYRPTAVTALAADPGASRVPLLAGREARDGRATAYVCRDFACRQPVTEPVELAAQLGDVA